MPKNRSDLKSESYLLKVIAELQKQFKAFRTKPSPGLQVVDGVTAPSAVAGRAIIYVDTADGDLKIKFGDGTTKTIVVDS